MLIGLAAVTGVVLRVVVYRSTLGGMNSDEAVTGLMIRHALHGHFAVFSWGAAYGGTQESTLAVPAVWIGGTNTLAIRVVPILLTAVVALLIWRVGRRTIGEPAAWVAGALFWVWPPRLLPLLLQPGFYSSDTFYCALILLLALRAKERPDALRAGVYGLVLGLAFWQTSQIVPIIAASALWLIWRSPRILRWSWLAALTAIVGALPWLIWNLEHHWGSLHLNAGTNFSYVHRLRLFFSPVLAEMLGLRIFYATTWIVPVLGLVVYIGAIGLFVWSGYRGRRRDTFLIYVVAGLFPFLYAASPKANLTTDPRYATVLVPCLALLLAQLGMTYWRAASLLALAAVVSAIGVHGANTWVKEHRRDTVVPTAPRSIAPLIATLDRLGVDRVFTNYWLAYRLDFDTQERIVAVENGFDALEAHDGDVLPAADPRVVYPPYDRFVRSGPHAFVFFDQNLPRRGELEELVAHGYTKHLVEGFVVYAPPVRS